jgi:GxxExxY protein
MFTTKDTKASADRLSYDILGAAIEVYRQLEYRASVVDCEYRVDLIVGSLVLVEVKSIAKVLPIHRAQAMTYLKLLKLNLEFILNFNVEKLSLGIHRIVMG